MLAQNRLGRPSEGLGLVEFAGTDIVKLEGSSDYSVDEVNSDMNVDVYKG